MFSLIPALKQKKDKETYKELKTVKTKKDLQFQVKSGQGGKRENNYLFK